MKPEITIITPTYNRAHTLHRVYESLKNQTFKNFKWLIMDDGSTDDTEEVVKKLISKNEIEIEYHHHTNVHKVVTMHRGFKLIKTPYLMRIDSDDYLPQNALQILYDNMQIIKDDDNISSVIGRVGYSTNKELGDVFPENPFIEYVFIMKYKYKIRGVHMGMFKTKMIKTSSFREEEYIGKGYLPDFWNIEIDSKYKTMFINDIVYIYDLNDTDQNSISNTKFNPKYAFGLSEQYRIFIKYYLPKYLLSYPIPIFKNMFKYIYYSSYIENNTIKKSLSQLENGVSKLLYLLILPFVILFKLKNKDLTKI
ncbi:MAG: glycosyltransferase family A protein [Bergeyella cardium]